MDGKGTATGGADALAQAIALKPDAIILGSVSIENNKALIKQAADQGIVVIGWHATDKPGPVADPPVFTNVGTDPYQIAYTAGEYAVVDSERHRRRRGDQRPAIPDRRHEERRHREGDQGMQRLHAPLRGQRPLRRGAAAHARR